MKVSLSTPIEDVSAAIGGDDVITGAGSDGVVAGDASDGISIGCADLREIGSRGEGPRCGSKDRELPAFIAPFASALFPMIRSVSPSPLTSPAELTDPPALSSLDSPQITKPPLPAATLESSICVVSVVRKPHMSCLAFSLHFRTCRVSRQRLDL